MSSQQDICSKFETEFSPCNDSDKLGIAIETIGKLQIIALRQVAEN